MKLTSVAPLEMQEYLNAATIARIVEDAGSEPATSIDLRILAFTIRQTLRLHRFAVVAWLAQQNVSVPVELLADELHPPPGGQTVDRLETE